MTRKELTARGGAMEGEMNVQREASRRDSERTSDASHEVRRDSERINGESEEALAVTRKELTTKARKHSP